MEEELLWRQRQQGLCPAPMTLSGKWENPFSQIRQQVLSIMPTACPGNQTAAASTRDACKSAACGRQASKEECILHKRRCAAWRGCRLLSGAASRAARSACAPAASSAFPSCRTHQVPSFHFP